MPDHYAPYYFWPLTTHQRAALLSILGDAMTREVNACWVDALTGETIMIGDLFTELMTIEPLVLTRPEVEEG